jgi:hypothetical protein
MKKRSSKAKSAKPSKAKQSAKRKRAAARREEEHFVATLEANRQIAPPEGPMPAGTTHRVETDKSGVSRVVRQRYSAL